MIVFDVSDDYVQLSKRLVGKQMRDNPDSYAFFMNFWDYYEIQKRAACNNYSNATDRDTILSGIACCLQFMHPQPEQLGLQFFMPIEESPYLICWIYDLQKFQKDDTIDVDKLLEHRVDIADAVMRLVKQVDGLGKEANGKQTRF